MAENGGDNPVAKAYLQTMKDLLTQMERMSSTQQFADSLAEPLTWPNKDEPPAMEQSTAGGHFMRELLKAKQGRKVRNFRLLEIGRF